MKVVLLTEEISVINSDLKKNHNITLLLLSLEVVCDKASQNIPLLFLTKISELMKNLKSTRMNEIHCYHY